MSHVLSRGKWFKHSLMYLLLCSFQESKSHELHVCLPNNTASDFLLQNVMFNALFHCYVKLTSIFTPAQKRIFCVLCRNNIFYTNLSA